MRYRLLQQFDPLADDRLKHIRDAGSVALGVRKVLYEAIGEYVAGPQYDDGNHLRLFLNRPGRRGPTRDNHIGGKAYKFGRVSADAGLIVGAEANLEPQVPTLGPTELC